MTSTGSDEMVVGQQGTVTLDRGQPGADPCRIEQLSVRPGRPRRAARGRARCGPDEHEHATFIVTGVFSGDGSGNAVAYTSGSGVGWGAIKAQPNGNLKPVRARRAGERDRPVRRLRILERAARNHRLLVETADLRLQRQPPGDQVLDVAHQQLHRDRPRGTAQLTVRHRPSRVIAADRTPSGSRAGEDGAGGHPVPGYRVHAGGIRTHEVDLQRMRADRSCPLLAAIDADDPLIEVTR